MLLVKDLAYTYPKSNKPSLNGISLSVRRGQILGLLGPNGAGKTTLISHLCGLLALQQGQIMVDDMPLQHQRRKSPARIAIAPQDFAFYPILTVTENLMCFAAASRLPRCAQHARAEACIALTQLSSYRNVRSERLSGGLKRRLNLAIALLPEPDFLLLDEPTVGVDPQSRAFILETVRQLAQAGMGILYTSHYMQEIEALANYIVIIDNGKSLRQGTLSEILHTDHAQIHIRLTLAGDSEQILSVLSHLCSLNTLGETYEVCLKENVTPATFFTAMEQANITVKHAEFGHQNLESLFMSLTHKALRD